MSRVLFLYCLKRECFLIEWQVLIWLFNSLFLQDSGENDGDADEDESLLGFWTSIGWLTILTIFISILSEYLVDAIEVWDCLISNIQM